MKKFILCCLLFLSFSLAKADLGIPTIQAICKVTLKDGSTVEGMISFGEGGYAYHYRPHGFCFIHEMGAVSLKLYDFDFRSFEPNRFHAYREGKARLYYLQNKNFQIAPETEYGINDSTQTLTRSTLDRDDFQLMDEMVMYKSLSQSLFVEGEKEKIRIAVSEIQSVELLENPGKAWLDLIKAARKKYEKESDDDESTEPVWYHEIIGDKALLEELKGYF